MLMIFHYSFLNHRSSHANYNDGTGLYYGLHFSKRMKKYKPFGQQENQVTITAAKGNRKETCL